MTLWNDEKYRKRFQTATEFFDFGFDSENEFEPKDLFVFEGNQKMIRSYISTYHYSQVTPDATTDVYIGKYGNQFAGACLFGTGVSRGQYSSVIPNIENGEYRELIRLWSPDNMPKNTESRLISESLKLLKEKGIKLVVSYSDPDQDHVGYIYQATNWYYIGVTEGGASYVTPEGDKLHPRSISRLRETVSKYAGKTNREIIEMLDLTEGQTSRKYKYVYLLGSKREKKRMLKEFEDKILPYPKLNQK